MKKIIQDVAYFRFYNDTTEDFLEEINNFLLSIKDELKKYVRFTTKDGLGLRVEFSRYETDHEYKIRIDREELQRKQQAELDMITYHRIKKELEEKENDKT
jgi:hypothetical protein